MVISDEASGRVHLRGCAWLMPDPDTGRPPHRSTEVVAAGYLVAMSETTRTRDRASSPTRPRARMDSPDRTRAAPTADPPGSDDPVPPVPPAPSHEALDEAPSGPADPYAGRAPSPGKTYAAAPRPQSTTPTPPPSRRRPLAAPSRRTTLTPRPVRPHRKAAIRPTGPPGSGRHRRLPTAPRPRRTPVRSSSRSSPASSRCRAASRESPR